MTKKILTGLQLGTGNAESAGLISQLNVAKISLNKWVSSL